MTVGELIAALSKYPVHYLVAHQGRWSNYAELSTLVVPNELTLVQGWVSKYKDDWGERLFVEEDVVHDHVDIDWTKPPAIAIK